MSEEVKEHGSSINFKSVKETSEAHNTRKQSLDYVDQKLSDLNESFSLCSIDEMEAKIKAYCKKTSGRKLQTNAIPIREAVVNIKSTHTMKDILRLSKALEDKFGIQVFQIHIHRDEGLKRDGKRKLNHHAHIVASWQDMKTGTMLRFKNHHLSQMQDLVAEELKMERGKRRTNTNTVRLEAVEYKVQQETKYLEKLKLEVKELEQKKNTVANRNNELREGNNELTRESEEYRERIYRLIQSNEQFRRGIETATRENNELRERIRTAEESSYNIINKAIRGVESLQEATETEIDIAITILDREFYKIEREIEELQREFKSITEGK